MIATRCTEGDASLQYLRMERQGHLMTSFLPFWRRMGAVATVGLVPLVALLPLVALMPLVARPAGAADNPAGPAVAARETPHTVTRLEDAPFAQDEDAKC